MNTYEELDALTENSPWLRESERQTWRDHSSDAYCLLRDGFLTQNEFDRVHRRILRALKRLIKRRVS